MPIEILMPALSPTMTDGTLAKWLKKEGDAVKAGQVIAEIETDKATMEVEAVDEGVMGKILVAAGTQNVPVNQTIALLLEAGEDKKALEKYKPKTTEVAKPVQTASAAPQAAPVESPQIAAPALAPKPSVASAMAAPTPIRSAANVQAPAAGKNGKGERIKASPLARRIAEEMGVDIALLSGTGPHGRIVREDVEAFASRGGSSQGVVRRHAQEFQTIANSTTRKVIAKRLLESKQQIPHFYLSVDCQLDKLLEVREDLNGLATAQAGKDHPPAYKLSVNDLIIKASALALKRIPAANASWYDDAIVQYNNVDIAVAVATDGGLITPIVRNADQKTLPQISNEMKELAKRARENKLKPEEFQGGGFSISNLGMYGIKTFSAIINPPQACILAVGAGEERAIVVDGKLQVANIMTVTLSVDHRAVDGAVGAQFLSAFKDFIEKPVRMLV